MLLKSCEEEGKNEVDDPPNEANWAQPTEVTGDPQTGHHRQTTIGSPHVTKVWISFCPPCLGMISDIGGKREREGKGLTKEAGASDNKPTLSIFSK